MDIIRVGLPKKQEWIEDLKFSPNGEYLLVGSHDNFLYLF
jgi:WD40 repeat protein